jgi:hypothetical protein
MSETDVALYANDVAGLLGDHLADVEAEVMTFMHNGEQDTHLNIPDLTRFLSGVDNIRYV